VRDESIEKKVALFAEHNCTNTTPHAEMQRVISRIQVCYYYTNLLHKTAKDMGG